VCAFTCSQLRSNGRRVLVTSSSAAYREVRAGVNRVLDMLAEKARYSNRPSHRESFRAKSRNRATSSVVKWFRAESRNLCRKQ